MTRAAVFALILLLSTPIAHGVPTYCTINYPGGCSGRFEEDPDNPGFGTMTVTCDWVIVYENYGPGSCDGHGTRA